LHEGRCLAEPAAVDDKPCIANPRGALHRNLGLGSDIERWSTRANGLQAQPSVIHCVKPALVGYSLLGPQAPHQSDGFVEARRTFRKRDAECLELRLPVTQANAENVITPAEHIQRGCFLGDVHWIERRQDQNVGADRHPLSMGCHISHHGRDLQHLHRLGQPVMREPEGCKTGLSRCMHLRKHLRDAFGNVEALGKLLVDEQTNVHEPLFLR